MVKRFRLVNASIVSKGEYKGHKYKIIKSIEDDFKVYVDGEFTRTMSSIDNGVRYAKVYIDAEIMEESKYHKDVASEFIMNNTNQNLR